VSAGYRRAFGGMTVSRLSLDYDITGSSFFGGARISAGDTKAEICPIFTYERTIADVPFETLAGLPLGESFKDLNVSKSLGVAVGRPVLRRGPVELVPTASVGFSRSDDYPDGFIDGNGRPKRFSTSAGFVQAGCGVNIGNRIAFTPTVSTLFWTTEGFQAATVYSVTMALSLRK